MPFDAGGFGQDAGMAAISAGLDYAGAASSARKQYKYQKKMYKHRYQWQTADMIKAGLNPMLSAGASAPVPGSVQGPDTANLGSKATSAYLQSKINRAQVDNIEQNTGLAKAQARDANAAAISKEYANWEKESEPSFQQVVRAHTPGAPVGTTAYSETKYKAGLDTINAQASKAISEAETARITADITRQELTQAEVRSKYANQLAELEQAYKAAMAEAARLKIPEAVAEAEFWQGAGFVGKAAIFLKGLFK